MAGTVITISVMFMSVIVYCTYLLHSVRWIVCARSHDSHVCIPTSLLAVRCWSNWHRILGLRLRLGSKLTWARGNIRSLRLGHPGLLLRAPIRSILVP